MAMSPQMQNQIMQLQQLQQQLQTIMNQKYQFDMLNKELDRALEELDNVSDKQNVYKSVGNLLIQTDDRKKLVDDMNSEKETLEIRIKGLDRQESTLKKKYEELQSSLSTGMDAKPEE